MNIRFLATVVVIACISTQSDAAPITQYRYSLIDNPDADVEQGERTSAIGINTAGDIVGSFGRHGFLYRNGTFQTIDVPGAYSTSATGINARGQIVGSFFVETGSERGSHGFIYDDGVYTTFDVPGAGTVNGAATRAFGINNRGEIVGSFDMQVGTGAETHGYLFSGGVFTIIDVPGAYFTQAFGINDVGDIVGSTAFPGVGGDSGFLYSRGDFSVLNNPASSAPSGAGLVTVATGINNRGQIVGLFTLAGAYRAFVYNDGVYTTLLAPPYADSPIIAYGINNAGVIVGTLNSASGVHGFLAVPTHEP